MQVCAHNLVAWSCDNMAWSRLLARVPGSNAPWLAGLLVAALTLAFALLNFLVGVSLVGAAALAAVAFFITGCAAFMLPTMRPELVENLPPLAKVRILGHTVFQIVGLISSAGFLYVVYAAVMYPAISGGTALYSIIMLIAVYVAGVIWFQVFYARSKHAARINKVDLDALLREIPTD